MQVYMEMMGSIVVIYFSIFNLHSIKFKLKQIILILAITWGISSIALAVGGEFIGIITALVISILFLYKESKKVVSSLAIPIISVLICIILDSIISNIYISIFKMDLETINKNIMEYWGSLVVLFIFAYVISKVLGILINKKNRASFLEAKGLVGGIIIISLILTLIVFYSNIILGENDRYGKLNIEINGVFLVFYSLLLVAIMYVLIKSIKNEIETKNKQIQLEQIQEYTSNLEEIYTDMRVFRHDYMNILSSMIGYIENKDIDGLEKHFNQNIIPLGKGMESNNFKIGLLKNMKIPELKGILSSKFIRAQELGIDIHIEIVEPIENGDIEMDMIDISRVIGILIDNAIEAAEKCDKPTVKIAVIKKESSVIILLVNSCEKDIPPIHKLFQKGFSTKGENRGLGLNNVKEILSKYTNTFLATSIENNEFLQNLEITNK